MRLHHLLATLALAVMTASCVDPADPAVTTDPAEAPPQQFCQPNYWANAPVPAPTAWANKLPQPDQGANQIWLMVPTDQGMTTYNLYQINQSTKTVIWWTQMSDQQRPYAGYLASLRPGTYVSIRNPPPPPFPPGDDWLHADQALNGALHIVGSWR